MEVEMSSRMQEVVPCGAVRQTLRRFAMEGMLKNRQLIPSYRSRSPPNHELPSSPNPSASVVVSAPNAAPSALSLSSTCLRTSRVRSPIVIRPTASSSIVCLCPDPEMCWVWSERTVSARVLRSRFSAASLSPTWADSITRQTGRMSLSTSVVLNCRVRKESGGY